MRKLIASVAVGVVAIATLTGCSVESGEERAACEANGGRVVKESFPTGKTSWWERRETAQFTFCKSSTGLITKVYNQHITEPGILNGHSDELKKCGSLKGELYYLTTRAGKITNHYYLCVSDGRAVWAK